MVLAGATSGLDAHAVASASSSRASGSFVSLARLGAATVIERFALRSGRRLGILARVPTARSNAGAVDVSEPHLTRAGSYVITLAHDVTCKPIASSECIPLGPNTAEAGSRA
jgi:hypothetical protein